MYTLNMRVCVAEADGSQTCLSSVSLNIPFPIQFSESLLNVRGSVDDEPGVAFVPPRSMNATSSVSSASEFSEDQSERSESLHRKLLQVSVISGNECVVALTSGKSVAAGRLSLLGCSHAQHVTDRDGHERQCEETDSDDCAPSSNPAVAYLALLDANSSPAQIAFTSAGDLVMVSRITGASLVLVPITAGTDQLLDSPPPLRTIPARQPLPMSLASSVDLDLVELQSEIPASEHQEQPNERYGWSPHTAEVVLRLLALVTLPEISTHLIRDISSHLTDAGTRAASDDRLDPSGRLLMLSALTESLHDFELEGVEQLGGGAKPKQSRLVLEDAIEIGPLMSAFALHSGTKEALLQRMRDHANGLGGLTWNVLQRWGAPAWVESLDVLRSLTEDVARRTFDLTKTADSVCLFYVVLNKVSFLARLYRTTSNTKVEAFLSRDFTQPANQLAAEKNAYKLLSLQRFSLAVAYLILAGKTAEAVRVCLRRLRDIPMAILICRLRPLADEITSVQTAFPHDTFLHHILEWHAGRYAASWARVFPPKTGGENHWERKFLERGLGTPAEDTRGGWLAACWLMYRLVELDVNMPVPARFSLVEFRSPGALAVIGDLAQLAQWAVLTSVLRRAVAEAVEEKRPILWATAVLGLTSVKVLELAVGDHARANLQAIKTIGADAPSSARKSSVSSQHSARSNSPPPTRRNSTVVEQEREDVELMGSFVKWLGINATLGYVNSLCRQSWVATTAVATILQMCYPYLSPGALLNPIAFLRTYTRALAHELVMHSFRLSPFNEPESVSGVFEASGAPIQLKCTPSHPKVLSDNVLLHRAKAIAMVGDLLADTKPTDHAAILQRRRSCVLAETLVGVHVLLWAWQCRRTRVLISESLGDQCRAGHLREHLRSILDSRSAVADDYDMSNFRTVVLHGLVHHLVMGRLVARARLRVEEWPGIRDEDVADLDRVLMGDVLAALQRLSVQLELQWRPQLRRLVHSTDMSVLRCGLVRQQSNGKYSRKSAASMGDAGSESDRSTHGGDDWRPHHHPLSALTSRLSTRIDTTIHSESSLSPSRDQSEASELTALPGEVFASSMATLDQEDTCKPPFASDAWNNLWNVLQGDQALVKWIVNDDLPLTHLNEFWHQETLFYKALLLHSYKNDLLLSLNVPQKYFGIMSVKVVRAEDIDTIKKDMTVFVLVCVGKCICPRSRQCPHKTRTLAIRGPPHVWNRDFEFVFSAFPVENPTVSVELVQSERLRRDHTLAMRQISLDNLPPHGLRQQWLKFGGRARVQVEVMYNFRLLPVLPAMSLNIHGTIF
eukprot:c5983_g1_i2.p1 GENE.c5983_g1_i2~~c5983_g1_i2.p1  ORF type:complete len:1378 (+),score=331.07 c5983_g1_i2:226-4134(+)